jgi:antitoxin YefM
MNITAFRDNVAACLDRVIDDRDILRVSRPNGRDVVVMAADDYDSTMEMLHLLRSPANVSRLTAAMADIAAGRVIKRDL